MAAKRFWADPCGARPGAARASRPRGTRSPPRGPAPCPCSRPPRRRRAATSVSHSPAGPGRRREDARTGEVGHEGRGGRGRELRRPIPRCTIRPWSTTATSSPSCAASREVVGDEQSRHGRLAQHRGELDAQPPPACAHRAPTAARPAAARAAARASARASATRWRSPRRASGCASASARHPKRSSSASGPAAALRRGPRSTRRRRSAKRSGGGTARIPGTRSRSCAAREGAPAPARCRARPRRRTRLGPAPAAPGRRRSAGASTCPRRTARPAPGNRAPRRVPPPGRSRAARFSHVDARDQSTRGSRHVGARSGA